MMLPVIVKLKQSLSVSENDSNMVKAVKAAALQNLNTRYTNENLNLHHTICSLLDSMYKDMTFDQSTKNDAIDSIIETALTIDG